MSRILVVDDESNVGMIFSKILLDEGHVLRHCSSSEEALKAVQEDPALEMVFLDIRLPGMDGLSALPLLLKANPRLRVVMMTAYQTVESVVNAMKLGAVDFLVKPLEPQIILQAVNKYGPPRSVAPVLEKGAVQKDPGGAAFAAFTPAMTNILSVADRFAASEGTVLLLGESGTGKELLAQYIHRKSPRKGRPFMVVDCASIPESLFESELFGYEKGAFTGADASKAGRFEQADGGTLFLDEIGNVPLSMQAKLLRFIEERQVTRLGGKRPLTLDIRLIAATNADLQRSVERAAFREDLYYRLSALTIHLPPFRNRPKEEKEFLVQHLLSKNADKLGRPCPRIADDARQLIQEYSWPGNVRELQNALYSALLLSDGSELNASCFPVGIQSYISHRDSFSIPSENQDHSLRKILKKVEKEQILATLKQTGGNKKRASEILDMDYKSFLNKLKEYGEEPEG
jgi:DNA-binding NtrC family response regulator